MKTHEVLTLNRELLLKLSFMGIRCEDCKYIDLYNEYLSLRENGEKVTYVVAVLSEKYNVSERQVYSIIRRFGRDCKPFTVASRE